MSYDDDDGYGNQDEGKNRPAYSVTLRVNVWPDGGLSTDLSRKSGKEWTRLGGTSTRSSATMSACAAEFAKLAVSMAVKYRKENEKTRGGNG